MDEHVAVIVVGNEDIRESIAVIVGDGDAHSLAQQLAHPRLRRNFCESSVPIIVIKQNGLGSILVRVTIRAVSIVEAAANRILPRRPVTVIRYDEVKVAIVVVIDPGRCHRPQFAALRTCAAHARCLRHIGESSVAIVSV